MRHRDAPGVTRYKVCFFHFLKHIFHTFIQTSLLSSCVVLARTRPQEEQQVSYRNTVDRSDSSDSSVTV